MSHTSGIALFWICADDDNDVYCRYDGRDDCPACEVKAVLDKIKRKETPCQQ